MDAVLPPMQVVDPHIHLWNIDRLNYPWLRHPAVTFMGDYAPLRRNYGPAEYLADAGAVEVLKVVHVEAGHDPAAPAAETAWLQSIAAETGCRGMPHGIVAYADLSQPDVERTLAAHAAHRNVRGIRQILNVHTDPLFDYVGRHFMREPAWRRNFALLHRYGFSFDLQLYPTQMAEAAQLAGEHPDTPLVLNHLGMFVDRSWVDGWRAWREGMRSLAACPNVTVKLCGQGMIDHAWTTESIRPYVLEAIDLFGVERCMFASNFPVDGLYGSFSALWQAYRDIVAGAGAGEQRALFRGNAERVYRI